MVRLRAWLLSVLLSLTDAALQEVHIGTSYGYKTKCVATRGPVRCPRHVSYVGNKPDTFQIYQQNGKVCARRTDYDGDWSVHLKVFCLGRSSSGISGLKKLRIGSSLDNNVKCVEDPGVKCDENAKQLGRTGKYPDTFHIYSHGNQICARRTDAPQGWGIDLVLRCQRTGSPKSWNMGGKTRVSIGSSLDSHVKCVDAPRAVHCDSTAKQLGRTGKYPDTFHIYHEGNRICARRTDAEAGWGLDLVLECTRSSGPSSGPWQTGVGGSSYGQRSDYHNYGSDYHYGGHHSGSLYIPSEHSELSYGSHYHSHYHGGHHYGGRRYGGSYGHFGSAGTARVSIGSSLDSHVKCVDAPRAVHCDSTAKQLGRTGKYPDTFHIYHEGDRICARRTDAEAGWGLDLELECRRATGGTGGGYGGYEGKSHAASYHSSASYKQSKKRVEIGSSDHYIKCVPDPGHVHCDNTASQVGRTGEFQDTFHIYHQGTQICARRTDAQAAWSIHLVLDCDLYYKKHYGNSGYTSPGTAFQIGSSPQSALKCVEDPGYLHCDDSAEQVGRTGEFPDTFHIYHEKEKICAQRTDAQSGWGLNLVLDCRPKGKQDVGYDSGQTDGYYITPKVKFCCAQHLFSEACPYDCEEGDGSAQVMWTSTKRDWCCRNRRMGCPGGRPAASMLDGGIGGTSYDCAVADPLSSASQGSDGPVVTAARYDCTHGSKESWSQDKAQYCRLWLDVPKGFHFTECDSDPIGWTNEKARWCQAVGLKQHAPHKCSRGHPDTWTQQKFEFCCVIKGIGCRQEDPLQMVLPETLKDASRNDWEEDASEDALDEAPSYPRPMKGDFAMELHFDCVADEEDMLEWSATRQRWCCQKWGMGCKAIGHFNCSAGLWNWQRGWSRQKKNYCCQHEEKGCDGTAHDCTQDTKDLSPDGKKWCCENHMYSNGCPFNCQHGLKLWKIGFSTAKKSWCCKYEQLACPEVVTHHVTHHTTHHAAHHVTHHVTHHVEAHGNHHWFKFAGAHAGGKPGFSACHNIADRPQGLVDWCCSELALCHLSVQFDCQVGVSRWTEWSSEKKHHCCGREVHCGHTVTHSVHHVVHHSSHFHQAQQLGHAELDDPQAWFNKKNVMNLHVGQSPDAGHKCVTPSEPVSCPMDAGNVRPDDYPDRFRVYRKGGQVCAQRTDYDKLWGLDLVLKCIKLDDHHFEKVHIGSSLAGSKKCVPQRSPVTCDDAASQAGRVDPHPDTFHVYHAGNEICVQRTDADSHWGVDLVLYCRQGSWSSPYWRASRMRTLKGAFYDSDVPTTSWTDRKPLLITSALVLIFLATLAMLMGKTYRQQHR